MLQGPPIAELIDGLLAAQKTIAGEPDWRDIHHDCTELVMPLQVDGVSANAELVLTAHPITGPSKYSILIKAPKCIWRVDHIYGDKHVNSFDRPSDLKESVITGPHYHAWADNRRFATPANLPNDLHNARILPIEGASFDSVFRWFCSQTNIDQPPPGLIDLPRRTRLL